MARPLKTVRGSRRRFLAGCAVAAGSATALAAQPARADCEAPRGEVQHLGDLHVGLLSELAEDDVVRFEYPEGHPCLLVRLREPATGGVGPSNTVVAFSAVCPHRGWRLDTRFMPAHGALGPCPAHNSTFDLCKGGAQVVGQANRDLPRVILEQRGDELFAIGLANVPFRFHAPADET